MRRQLFQIFVVRTDAQADHDHWQGGPPEKDGAICLRCDQPMQLIWNINGNDPRFRTVFGRKKLDLKRIPLYFCFSCFSAVDYLIEENGSVTVLAADGKGANEVVKQKRPRDFPYENFPSQFPKQKIGLYSLDQLPKSLVKFVRSEPTQPLTNKMKKRTYLGGCNVDIDGVHMVIRFGNDVTAMLVYDDCWGLERMTMRLTKTTVILTCNFLNRMDMIFGVRAMARQNLVTTKPLCFIPLRKKNDE